MFVFLSGAEMQPEQVRVAWPGAQFVARGCLQADIAGAETSSEDLWGILVEIPGAGDQGAMRAAISDDGRSFSVTVPPPNLDDPAAVLAAARYWELPPHYVRRLMLLANAPLEEYVS